MRNFYYEYIILMEDLRNKIRECQRKEHTQQVAYSTYHDALTQVCFSCNKVRTNISEEVI